ncbi:MAG: hypothetical protein HY053_01120 [Proteobacteria bacterium]|nr:hypothetical protein [Pseudomonadota bacterium]
MAEPNSKPTLEISRTKKGFNVTFPDGRKAEVGVGFSNAAYDNSSFAAVGSLDIKYKNGESAHIVDMVRGEPPEMKGGKRFPSSEQAAKDFQTLLGSDKFYAALGSINI